MPSGGKEACRRAKALSKQESGRGGFMGKIWFYLLYIPCILALGALYFFLYSTGVSGQTEFYIGESVYLALFYLLGGLCLAGLYIWAARAASRLEGARISGDSFLWGAAGILCGVLFVLDAAAHGWQAALPYFSGADLLPQKLLLPGLELLLALGAALALIVLGIRLLRRDLSAYRYSRSLLFLIMWRILRLVVRFGQLPMAFRMPQRLLEILLSAAQCLFFLAGSHLLCNVVDKKVYRLALFSGHSAVAMGVIWCACPLLAQRMSFPTAAQALDYALEWGFLLFIGLFSAFITPSRRWVPDSGRKAGRRH